MDADLKRIIEQVAREKGLEPKVLIDALEEAIKSAVRKRYGVRLELEVAYNENTGEVEVYQYRDVVEKVSDTETEISLEEALELDPESELGDSIGTLMDISNLGRIAAQSARQVIIQKMKNAERDLIYEEFKDREFELINGIVQRFERGGVIVNIGRTEALLPSSEQISSESYRRGDRIRAIIIEVRKGVRDTQVILSRTHPQFLVKLFELEVPEIADGIVKIMGVAREPGSRAKIAVSSSDSYVDPVGACVGMRGSRVQAVVQELRGEKIDIIPWSPDPAKYVYNALAPAECSQVIVDEANESLEVVVPDDQLSLAIGRQGQNVRLAARLLDWKIDVKSETRYAHYQDPKYVEMLKLEGMTENIADRLYKNGITSIIKLAKSDPAELRHDVAALVDTARAYLAEKGVDWETALDEDIEAESRDEGVQASDEEVDASEENDAEPEEDAQVEPVDSDDQEAIDEESSPDEDDEEISGQGRVDEEEPEENAIKNNEQDASVHSDVEQEELSEKPETQKVPA